MRVAQVAELFTAWSFAPAPALLVATTGALYFIGVERLRERGRTVLWFLTFGGTRTSLRI